MRRAAGLALMGSLAVLFVCPARAKPPTAADFGALEDCVKAAAPAGVPMYKAESCIGMISEPCLKGRKPDTNAAIDTCIVRERSIWDNILNETYRNLGNKLDAQQQVKLRDMQRDWIASRDASCGFYREYYGAAIANPLAASCLNRETARRALFLLGFFLEVDK